MMPIFPYFGNKTGAVELVWARFGKVSNYVEPFAGSLAVLLGNPCPAKTETINDLDGLVANFWRALAAAADEVARHADWPVNETDLEARLAWLVARRPELERCLADDPFWYDARAAGWWIWGISQWIGSGWGHRAVRQMPNVANRGKGIHGRTRQESLHATLKQVQTRIRHVRVCSGDWTRIMTRTVLFPGNDTVVGVLLDPPYDHAGRAVGVYAEDTTVAHAVGQWAFEHGSDDRLRIALCGYEGQYPTPSGWTCETWDRSTGIGYANQAEGQGRVNSARERIWFSPGCQRAPDFQSVLDFLCD